MAFNDGFKTRSRIPRNPQDVVVGREVGRVNITGRAGRDREAYQQVGLIGLWGKAEGE